MLFANSFGDAISNPDPWQMILGAIVPLLMVWLRGRFPFLETILKALGVNLQPAPSPDKSPVSPPAPTPQTPLNALLSALKEIVAELLKRKQENASIDAAVKEALEATK